MVITVPTVTIAPSSSLAETTQPKIIGASQDKAIEILSSRGLVALSLIHI